MVATTYYSPTTITLPKNSINIKITIAGAKGGDVINAYQNLGWTRRDGGNGAFGVFTFNSNDYTTTKTLGLYVPTVGSNGGNPTGGNGGSGISSGGKGWTNTNKGTANYGGAGGGGSGGVTYNNSVIIVAGGGGGASGTRYIGYGGGVNGYSAILFSPPVGVLQNGQNAFASVLNVYAGGGGGGGTPGGAYASQYDAAQQQYAGVGGGSSYNSNIVTLNTQNYYSGTPYITVEYDLYVPPPPSITSFYASPNPQTSGSAGTPAYNTTLYWTTTNSSSVSIDQGIGSGLITNSSYNVTNLPQSLVGSNSPATRTYTLTAYGIEANYGLPTTSTTSSITVSVYNDNVPNDYTVPSQNNQEPNRTIIWSFGPISGIDMTTTVTASSGCDVSLNSSNWSSTVYVTSGQTIYLRTTTLPFNTDPNGLTNTKNLYVDVGPLRKYFTVTTRAPNIQEIFDFGNSSVNYPYPDIDQVANTPTQYLSSPTKYLMGDSGKPPDAEIPVEIKVNDPNVQVRITPIGVSVPGDWINVRQI